MPEESPYGNASRELLAKARQELAEGDSRQASEKAWGAAAQMVKAVSDSRGWPHGSHSLLYQAVDNLVKETGNRQIFTLFGNAGNLHVNFHENWQSAEMVASGIQDVELFLNELDSLL